MEIGARARAHSKIKWSKLTNLHFWKNIAFQCKQWLTPKFLPLRLLLLQAIGHQVREWSLAQSVSIAFSLTQPIATPLSLFPLSIALIFIGFLVNCCKIRMGFNQLCFHLCFLTFLAFLILSMQRKRKR